MYRLVVLFLIRSLPPMVLAFLVAYSSIGFISEAQALHTNDISYRIAP